MAKRLQHLRFAHKKPSQALRLGKAAGAMAAASGFVEQCFLLFEDGEN